MIYGIGTDIAQVDRFEKWVKEPEIIQRFFNPEEYFSKNQLNDKMEPVSKTARLDVQARHYAARFAAKEAFSKALGTGFSGLRLSDFFVRKTPEGKPFFSWGEKTQKVIEKRIGSKFNVQLSISHEKEYAVAFVIIEILD